MVNFRFKCVHWIIAQLETIWLHTTTLWHLLELQIFKVIICDRELLHLSHDIRDEKSASGISDQQKCAPRNRLMEKLILIITEKIFEQIKV